MAEVLASLTSNLKTAAEGALSVAKGIYDPTLPLKATLQPLTEVPVPLAYHTISIVRGRAYLFGGKTTSKDGGSLQLAERDMHIVILPSAGGMESMDYKKIDATDAAPPKRSGHSAAVVDERIYVFGGCGEDGEVLDEGARVWVFDATNNKWSYLDPPSNSEKPEARASHASVASEHPQHTPPKADAGILPQDPPDPEKMMPEIPDPGSYGTLIIHGGQGKGEKTLTDLWTFDISTRTWTELPEPPPPSSTSPSLSMVDGRLYVFSAGQTSYIDLTPSSFDDRGGKGELGLAPLSPFQTLPPSSSDPDRPYPGERTAAAMEPVTTGQGRNYLLLLGGKHAQLGEALEDIWTLQLKPEGMTSASFKDAARQALQKETMEAEWREVKYASAEGVIVQEGQSGRGIGRREGFAADRAANEDGGSVIVWGGVGGDGRVRGDGVMVTVTA